MKNIFVPSFTLLFLSILMVFTLSLTSPFNSANASNNLASPSSLEGLDVRSALKLANQWKLTNPEVTSFITPRHLQFKFRNGQEVNFSLPEDQMVIAIAPYITYTHPCQTHYISGCQGELSNTPISVKIKNMDGSLFKDLNTTTMHNGFVELWLPRDRQFTIYIEKGEHLGAEQISTWGKSRTCITTLKLN